MSTRSTTHFTLGEETVAIVYRHSDGYPEGAGTDLLRFLDQCSKLKDPRFTDPAYLAAKYVVFLADMFNYLFEFDWKGGALKIRNKSKLEFISVGILLEDPEDIRYRYIVSCDNIQNGKPTVTCYPVSFSYPKNVWTRGEPVDIPKPEVDEKKESSLLPQ